jgi:antitoxin (DNA-binding transcriptional repressor) of toxin-antitoxin stability system
MCHIEHMPITISIRELHMNTGKWVRQAGASAEPVIVLDRGHPIARLSPIEERTSVAFSRRHLVPGFEALKPVALDSGRILEEDRR